MRDAELTEDVRLENSRLVERKRLTSWRWRKVCLLVLIAVGMSWVFVAWNANQRSIGSEVERAGGRHFAYSNFPVTLRFANAVFGGPSTQTHQIAFTPGQVTDEWLIQNRERLNELPTWNLELRGTRVSDAGIAALVGNPHLQTLVVRGTKLTDAAIDSLNHIPRLKLLDISRTGITAEGVARLNRLEWAALTLDASQLTPAVVTHLSQLKGLHGLGIYDADDASISLLANIPFKHSLVIQGQQVTSVSLPLLVEIARTRNLQSMQLLDTTLTSDETGTVFSGLSKNVGVVITSEAYERMYDSFEPKSNNSLW